MGAIKSNINYSENDWQLSVLARALAHPARIQMIKTLRKYRYFTNVDFSALLNLAPSTINQHIEKLKDAELIGINYYPHYYCISLNPKKLHTLSRFIHQNH